MDIAAAHQTWAELNATLWNPVQSKCKYDILNNKINSHWVKNLSHEYSWYYSQLRCKIQVALAPLILRFAISWLKVSQSDFLTQKRKRPTTFHLIQMHVFLTKRKKTQGKALNCARTFRVLTITYILGCPTLHLFWIELHPINRPCHWVVWGHKKFQGYRQ